MLIIIPIEVLVFVGLILTAFGWWVWFNISRKRNVRRYKKENDKGRESGKKIKDEVGGNRESEFRTPEKYVDVARHGKFEERSLLQTTDINNTPKHTATNRRNSKLHKIFRRRTRK